MAEEESKEVNCGGSLKARCSLFMKHLAVWDIKDTKFLFLANSKILHKIFNDSNSF